MTHDASRDCQGQASGLPSLRAALAVAALCALLLPSSTFAQSATVRGRVLSATTGQPIANATLSLSAVARTTRTDSLGEFTLSGLPPGEQALLVQAVGYTPVRALVPLTAGPPIELDVDLDPLPPVLDRVVTEADVDAPRNFNIGDFDDRRARGLGRFITRAELLRDRGRPLDAVLRARVPGVRYHDEGGKVIAASGRDGGKRSDPGAKGCYVNVIVDGVLRYGVGTQAPFFDLRSLEVSMIAGIEYYTVASLPAQFNLRGSAPCGTLVIWMQN
jgi:hypothetical protein